MVGYTDRPRMEMLLIIVQISEVFYIMLSRLLQSPSYRKSWSKLVSTSHGCTVNVLIISTKM
ncbi:hypothetical protein DJ70_04570 [Halorubrum halodurans]|uniref:Uncharacterized protein n=1 Tax=Halorubrum halodurans TaxID=1383851 RepID=A0A256IP88_9EURY|nr:hypothetical protein DJ70_04570 [Halorubrum halodurans]